MLKIYITWHFGNEKSQNDLVQNTKSGKNAKFESKKNLHLNTNPGTSSFETFAEIFVYTFPSFNSSGKSFYQTQDGSFPTLVTS